jgi:hypothetical protein
MAKFRAEDSHAIAARRFLRERGGLSHIRARCRADVLTLESGRDDDPIPHARLRREGVHLWRLEMPTSSGRWEKTPHRAQLGEVLDLLADAYGWMLAPN